MSKTLPHHSARGLRAIAGLEAFKGAIVLLAGLGLLALLHHNVQAGAERLVAHFHLNPASRYPRIFVEAASTFTDQRLWLLAAAAAGYAALRFIEAYGLWCERRWAEWLAVLSGSIYIPVELYELLHGSSWLKWFVLGANIVVVGYVSRVLWGARREESPPRTTAE